jgi:glycosyltransferase involved in cell wall biosynthesis
MRILHVFRSPVGGLFRHVADLARGQHSDGHNVALYCDSSTGGEHAAKSLKQLEQYCELGIMTEAISRMPSPSDWTVVQRVKNLQKLHHFDVIHGHGAKGGLIARLAALNTSAKSIYTPHGGSLHFSWASVSGLAFLSTEKILSRLSDGFVFVCKFEKDAFIQKIGLAGRSSVIVNNALWPEEFSSQQLNKDATDLLYVGEVRYLKGIDVLFDALIKLASHRRYTLTVVGDGPELQNYQDLAVTKGLSKQVTFAGRLPISKALTMGRVMIVPSRNESFPYVVLEAIAGETPLIATDVGGIPEVLPTHMMVKPEDVSALAQKIEWTFSNLDTAQTAAKSLAKQIRNTSTAQSMAQAVTAFYQTLP